jgi:hypothetical protein
MFVAVTVLLLLPTRAQAQLESLTVTLSPGAVNFALTKGSAVNAGNAAIAATLTWSVLPLVRNNVSLYAYFSSSTAALVHVNPANTVDIPSARVEVSINGAARVPFTQTAPFGAPSAGRLIFSQAINLFNGSGNHTDSLALNINLSGYTLPADTYTGTLRLRARATP